MQTGAFLQLILVLISVTARLDTLVQNLILVTSKINCIIRGISSDLKVRFSPEQLDKMCINHGRTSNCLGLVNVGILFPQVDMQTSLY
jgi:hypothetical protein